VDFDEEIQTIGSQGNKAPFSGYASTNPEELEYPFFDENP
jgi:hypothetical protein